MSLLGKGKAEVQEGAVPEAEIEKADRVQRVEGLDYEVIDTQVVTPRVPLIRNGLVVYLGAARNKVVSMVGRLLVDRVQIGEDDKTGEPIFHETRAPSEVGIEAYDFSTHDSLGRLIKPRLLSGRVSPDLRGKPFTRCEHAEHLRRFLRMRNEAKELEFRVLVESQYRQDFQEYVRRKEQQMGAQKGFEQAVTSG